MARPEFRRSQGIVPFGVGAIIDFPDESLMMAGLDVWPVQLSATSDIAEATRVIDSRLQARLSHDLGRSINQLFMPTEAPDRKKNLYAAAEGYGSGKAPMPFVRFPEWHFCPRCRAMQLVGWNVPSNDERLRCSNSVFRRKAKAGTKPCNELKKYSRPRLVPVRFVVACQLGHLSDFPWVEWAHRGKTGCGTSVGTLFLVSTGGAGLDGLKVECRECGAENTMRGAFKPDILEKVTKMKCMGERPWLGPKGAESCNEKLQTVQRGASNIYFPRVVSSILIPPYSERLHRILDNPNTWQEILDVVNVRVNGEGLEITSELFQTKARRHGIEPELFAEAIKEKLNYPEQWQGNIDSTESGYRYAERKAFLGSRPAPEERKEFDVKKFDVREYAAPIPSYISNIILLPRLRETRALVGFSRLVPPTGLGESVSPLALGTLDWLPAVAVHGEGIFLEFREEALEGWERYSSKLTARIDLVNTRFEQTRHGSGRHKYQYPNRQLLLHTISHLLIRQLSFSCGYDASSLKERLYVSDDPEKRMSGILIYTVSGDAEGSLGGLVRQGEPGLFENTFVSCVRNAEFCASDPLCLESAGQGFGGLNFAACHACALLPETSCELGNTVLDRCQVIGTIGSRGEGFLSSLIV